MPNPTAGIGDPYWYEWSVGLLYILDLLVPDENVKHVILQDSTLQGLDDIVVEYNDGSAKCVQIKHSRIGDNFTFSDLIEIIYNLYSDWKKKTTTSGMQCVPIVYTNRSIGTRASSIDKMQISDLSSFWKSFQDKLKTATMLSDITFEGCDTKSAKESTTWMKLVDAFGTADHTDIFGFLSKLQLVTNQDDLDEIFQAIDSKLMAIFSINNRLSVQLHQKLAYALSSWATTIRQKPEINKEDLLEALSLAGDKIIGEHHLPTCEPFFQSRVDFARMLEDVVLRREMPVVFLSGAPGSGKTNVINYLSNKSDSAVTLRFHAFKPLNPADEYLSADKGISDPKSLWGNLLIELREIFANYHLLSEYNVKPSIEMIESIDILRAEVMRLAESLSIITGKVTVIAIDGIDHAARTGANNTFLSTLPLPSNIPESVCFLIAGQPVTEYTEYPYFLSDKTKTLTLEIPSISAVDVAQLYDSLDTKLDIGDRDTAVRIIHNVASGNTLATVFAIQEATRCNSLDELQQKLDGSNLACGIEEYYNYIWTASITMLPPSFFYIDTNLACILVLWNKQLSVEMLHEIYPAISCLAWNRILEKLYPILTRTDTGHFIVFHNDIRVYLGKKLKTNLSAIHDVSIALADYLLGSSCDIKSKHELVFDLLRDTHQEHRLSEVFTRQYVTEALQLKRSMLEITNQLNCTLDAISHEGTYVNILSVSCAVATLYQFQQSLQWMDKTYSAVETIPLCMPSEKKVVQRPLFTADIISDTLSDVLCLTYENEIVRAKNIVTCWFGGMNVLQLVDLLYENCQCDTPQDTVIDMMKVIATMCGRISQHMDSEFESFHIVDGNEDIAASFSNGVLMEAQTILSPESILRTFSKLNIYYSNDLEEYIKYILEKGSQECIATMLKHIKHLDSLSNKLKICIVFCALQNGLYADCTDWIYEIVELRYQYIDMQSHDYVSKKFALLCQTAFILAYIDAEGDLVKECNIIFQNKIKEGFRAAFQIIKACVFMGEVTRRAFDGSIGAVTFEHYIANIEPIVNPNYRLGSYELHGFDIVKHLLRGLLQLYPLLSSTLQKAFDGTCRTLAVNVSDIEYIDIYWGHLVQLKQTELLKKIYDTWMQAGGLVWNEELYITAKIAGTFIEKATQLGWNERVEQARMILDSKTVGYVGHKEYSLFQLEKWYKALCSFGHHHWRAEGLLMMNISKIASRTGDNRAALYIDAVVSKSAAILGPDELWNFANLTDDCDDYWSSIIFDGIIAAMEFSEFTEKELLEIWATATKVFFISKYDWEHDFQSRKNRIYLADIKMAILLVAKRCQYQNLAKQMQKVSMIAYEQKRVHPQHSSVRIPERWFDDTRHYNDKAIEFEHELKRMAIEEAFARLMSELDDQNNYSKWAMANVFLKKVQKENLDQISLYSSRLVTALRQRSHSYWHSDGADRLIEQMFVFLSDEDRKILLRITIQNYFDRLEEYSIDDLYGLKNDLEMLANLYYRTLSEDEVQVGFSEVAQMHIDWITGSQRLAFEEILNLTTSDSAKDWIEFCNKVPCWMKGM